MRIELYEAPFAVAEVNWLQADGPRLPMDGLNKSVDCSSTHRKLSRADGLFRVSLVVGIDWITDILYPQEKLMKVLVMGAGESAGIMPAY